MPPLLVVVGQTASGKSALALHLAQQLDGELICADSWTVRRGMDTGTAKPSAVERRLVRHHLLDIVEPDEDFSAAIFKRLATHAIADVTSRGKVPVLVGGTGLYVDGILFDYNFLPAGPPGLRAELDQLSLAQLLTRISAAGIALGSVDTRNKRRLIRLLETKAAPQTKSDLRRNTLIVGIRPNPAELQERISQRVDSMFTDGLQAEAKRLADTYGWDCEGLKGIGYREWQNYFAGTQSLQITRQRIISATQALAKRQRTWFQQNKSIHWFNTPVDYVQVDDLVTTFLST